MNCSQRLSKAGRKISHSWFRENFLLSKNDHRQQQLLIGSINLWVDGDGEEEEEEEEEEEGAFSDFEKWIYSVSP